MQTIFERTGDSRWYLKGTDVGELPEIAAVLVKLLVETKDGVGAD